MKKLISITMGIIGLLGLGAMRVDAAPYKYHGYIYEGEKISGVYYKNKDNTLSDAKIFKTSDSENITYSIEYDNDLIGATRDDYDDTFDYRKTNLTKKQTDRMNLIGYYGYNYKDDLYDHTDIKWYAITQFLIWQVEGDNALESLVDVNGNKIYEEEIRELKSILDHHYIKPDFGTTKFTTKIYDELTIEDKNNVINEYDIMKINDIKYQIHDNKIDIITEKDDTYTLSFSKKASHYTKSTTFFISDKYRNAMQVGKFDTLTSNILITSIGGKIFVNKAGEQLIDYQDDKFIYNYQQVKGSVYYLYAKDDIYNNVGKLLYHKDEKVSELTTGENKNFANLYPSKYYVKEIVNAYPYLINNNITDVDLDLDNPYQTLSFSSKFQDVTVSFKNFKQSTNYENGESKYSYLLTPGIEFGLYNSEDIYSNPDSTIPIVKKGTLLGTSVSDETGIVSFDLDLPLGSYYIVKLTEDEKYYGNFEKSPFTFAFDSGSEDRHYNLMDYYNLLNTKNIIFSSESKEKKLKIYNEDKSIIISDNVEDSYSLTLPFGAYYYQIEDGNLYSFVVNTMSDDNIKIEDDVSDNKIPGLIPWGGNPFAPKDEEPKKDITQNVFKPITPNEDEKDDEEEPNKEEDKEEEDKEEEDIIDEEKKEEEIKKEEDQEEEIDNSETDENTENIEEKVDGENNGEENENHDPEEDNKEEIIVDEELKEDIENTEDEKEGDTENNIEENETTEEPKNDTYIEKGEEETVEEQPKEDEPSITIPDDSSISEDLKEDIALPKEEDVNIENKEEKEMELEKIPENSKEDISSSEILDSKEKIDDEEIEECPILPDEIPSSEEEENVIKESEVVEENKEEIKLEKKETFLPEVVNRELNVSVPATDKFDFIFYISIIILLSASLFYLNAKE
ncbi:MAG: Cys-Gln thioester bond-forming surface protein [Bacilli bacterium]|nr:Cys-Gln thioester bond-forming surface protein [Bacilli bacterium]